MNYQHKESVNPLKYLIVLIIGFGFGWFSFGVNENSAVDIDENNVDEEEIYVYDLKEDVDLDTVNKYVRPRVIEQVKTSKDLKGFRDNDVTLYYRYYDTNAQYVMEFKITPDIYK